MKNLRILHVTHSLQIGGLERVVVNLAKAFKERKHDVSICCLDGKGALAEEIEGKGIRIFSLRKKPGIVWNLPLKIMGIVKEGMVDVVHTHNEAGLVYGATAGLLAGGRRIVHTEHGKEPGYEKRRILHVVEKLLHRKVKKVVAVSKDLRDRIAESSGTKGDRIAVISNGVDVEKYFRPESRSEMRISLGIDPESFVIGNVARLVPLKNQKFLLTVFREVVKDVPNLRLIIIGDGPLREDLEYYSRQIGISKFVMFLGERKDVPDLFPIFDLFALPSLTEGISITLLEAMAAGIPVVASEVGGNSEIIEDGKSGFLIPLGSEEMWIGTIKTVIKNDGLRRDVSRMANARVTERFSLVNMVDEYERLYYT